MSTKSDLQQKLPYVKIGTKQSFAYGEVITIDRIFPTSIVNFVQTSTRDIRDLVIKLQRDSFIGEYLLLKSLEYKYKKGDFSGKRVFYDIGR